MWFQSCINALRSRTHAQRRRSSDRYDDRRRPLTRRPLFVGLEQRQLLTFAAAVDCPVGASPQAVVTADFNNDGQLDLVTANTETVSFRPGDGSGGFGAAITSAAASATYLTPDRSLAVGDLSLIHI